MSCYNITSIFNEFLHENHRINSGYQVHVVPDKRTVREIGTSVDIGDSEEFPIIVDDKKEESEPEYVTLSNVSMEGLEEQNSNPVIRVSSQVLVEENQNVDTVQASTSIQVTNVTGNNLEFWNDDVPDMDISEVPDNIRHPFYDQDRESGTDWPV